MDSAGALALADYDADGDLDLFVGGTHVPNRYPESASSQLFQYEQGRWSLDEKNSAALQHVGIVNGAVWSDLDGDGFPELILACEWGPVRVFQMRSGPMREVTAQWGLAKLTGWWTGVTTGDFDGDGHLDIVAGNWGWNSPYRASPEEPLSLFYGDLAGLNRVDLLECEFDTRQRQPAPRMLRDDLVEHLPFILEKCPTHAAWSVVTAAQILQDRPGPIHQLKATTLASTVFFNRQGTFAAKELPIEVQMAPAFGVTVADFDGDGNEDIFLSQNFFAFRREEERLDAGRGLLLRGDGRGQWHAMPGQVSGLILYGEQRGAAAADFNQDGRMDLAVGQNASNTKLFRNVRGRPGWRVRLVGPDENPLAVGSVVRLQYGQRWGPARELRAGSGYLSQDGATLVLGSNGDPTAVWVRWPGGRTATTPLPAGSREVTVPYARAALP
jgi:hypothetical protein